MLKDFLDSKGIKYELITCNNFAEATNLVIQNEADAIIGDEQIVLYHLYSNKLTAKVKKIGYPLYIGKNCMGMREGQVILQGIINKGIALAHKRNIFDSVNKKWIGTHYSMNSNWLRNHYIDIVIALIFVFIIIIAVLFWNFQLRKNVNSKTRELSQALQEKIAVQQNLLEEKELLAITFRSIGDAVITSDINGNVVLMNKVAEELTGWNQTEAEGKPLTEVFRIVNEFTLETVENPVSKVLKEGHIVGLANHTILYSKNGSKYNIADSAAPIRNSRSEICGVVLVFRNVTEALKIQEELFRTRKLESVGILAGGIAHDFNNILTGFFGSISLAKLYLTPEDKAFEFMENAELSLEKAINLTKQLLTFSKGGDPIIKTLAISEYLKEIAQFHLIGSNIKLNTNIAENLWFVDADKGQLDQVISNLIVNAKQAMTNGGTIRLMAENIINTGNIAPLKDGNFVKISVSDEGTGIPLRFIDKIFDPYFSTKHSGSGLGLATVHSIITKHNGLITVESAEGKGTVFDIYLPASTSLVPDVEEKLTDHTHIKHFGSSRKILLMDDESLVRQTAGSMLNTMGFSVDLAAEGKEAILKFKSARESGEPYDIVIMDLTIPGGMGGKEAVKEILSIDPQARIIVSSGYSTDPVMSHYREYGFLGMVTKPYRINDLKEVISTLPDV